MLFIEHIQNARDALRSNRLRTLLTITGVAIGVASVTAILSLASGIGNIVSGQVDTLGGNIAVIRPGAKSGGINDFANPTPFQAFATSTINEQDLRDIQAIPGVDGAAPLMLINGTLKSNEASVPGAPIVASTRALADIAKLKMFDGDFIDDTDGSDLVVVGAQLSIDLFGTDRSLGQTVTIRGQEFRVTGVMSRRNDPINYNNVDFDNTAIINLTRGKQFNQGLAQIQQIDVRASNVSDLPAVVQHVDFALSKNHVGEKDYTIMTGKEIAQPTSRLFTAIAGVTAAIAGISLIVGGIGIMNIMLVGVAERTREIGLRKAVGASTRNIVEQFLIESLIISLAGGFAGYVVGYVAAFIISTFLTFDPVLSWQIAAIALGISVFIGVIFGIYPAIRAARKDPIESLRQYH